MKIAIFDYLTTTTNPAGSCQRAIIQELGPFHEFTLFSREYERLDGVNVKWVKVWCVRRPLALLYLTFHVSALACYLWQIVVRGRNFDIVQFVESNILFGNLCYAHFCHKEYLRAGMRKTEMWSLAGLARVLDHALHAAFERYSFSRSRRIVVPAEGLAREICSAFDVPPEKCVVVPNPLKFKRSATCPEDVRAELRRQYYLGEGSIVLLFVALGHFERKGLPELLNALPKLKERNVKLVVVGGQAEATKNYAEICQKLHIEQMVQFHPPCDDVRRFYWMADALCLPSKYEVQPLVAIEASACGLPLIATTVNGLGEILRDGFNGIAIQEPTAKAIGEALERFAALEPCRRREMGQRGVEISRIFDLEGFGANWQRIYGEISREVCRHVSVANSDGSKP